MWNAGLLFHCGESTVEFIFAASMAREDLALSTSVVCVEAKVLLAIAVYVIAQVTNTRILSTDIFSYTPYPNQDVQAHDQNSFYKSTTAGGSWRKQSNSGPKTVSHMYTTDVFVFIQVIERIY